MNKSLINALERILQPFIEETLPNGGIDISKSLWQKPGRGFSGNIFPGGADIRYLRFLVEALYRISGITDNKIYRRVADAHCHFVAEIIKETHPTWAMGNALEMIGLYHRFNERDDSLVKAARKIVKWARKRKVRISIDGVTYDHFPCGYGLLDAKDAGWTNDLSMLGSGLVWAYELTGDKSILKDGISFAEYFVQPWRANALKEDGYWHCGSWREDIGSWVIGPAHYSGFESTDVYADEASWVFSTVTCIDYLTRLYRHKSDPRFLDRCIRSARWTFEKCQFEDGAVGMCGRDDKWLGFTGDAVRQIAMLKPLISDREVLQPLLNRAKLAYDYLCTHLPDANIEQHGVEWVNYKTSTDPLVNVAMLWTSAVLGVLDGQELWQ